MQNAQPSSERYILFALGGTGGHLFPALSLARALKEKGREKLLFAGSGLASNSFFENEAFAYRELSAATPFSKRPLAAARSLVTLSKGVREALALIRDIQPGLVIGFGSFHAFPLMMAARLKKIPYLLFEPNAFLGKVNRLFAKKALHPLPLRARTNIFPIHLARREDVEGGVFKGAARRNVVEAKEVHFSLVRLLF